MTVWNVAHKCTVTSCKPRDHAGFRCWLHTILNQTISPLPLRINTQQPLSTLLPALPGGPFFGLTNTAMWSFAFSALTLLVGRQACKKSECWGADTATSVGDDLNQMTYKSRFKSFPTTYDFDLNKKLVDEFQHWLPPHHLWKQTVERVLLYCIWWSYKRKHLEIVRTVFL